MVTRLGFIFGATVFLFFVTQVSALIGSEIISGFQPLFELQLTSIPLLDTILFLFNNIGVFLGLLAISTEIQILSIILTPILLGVLWSIIEVIRGS